MSSPMVHDVSSHITCTVGACIRVAHARTARRSTPGTYLVVWCRFDLRARTVLLPGGGWRRNPQWDVDVACTRAANDDGGSA